MVNSYLAEDYKPLLVAGPVDLNTAAVAGSRVSMKGVESVAFVVAMGTSTAAVVEFTLQQHNAPSAGTSKALPFNGPIYYKAGAATEYTKIEGDVFNPISTIALSTQFAADAGIVIIEVRAPELDVNNGFAYASLNIADTTAAKIGSVMAFVEHGQKPSSTAVTIA